MNDRTTDEQARLDTIERAMTHWHRRELDDYFSLYRPDATLHHTHGDFDVSGAHLDYLALFDAMPDATITFDHVLVDGDLAAMNFTLTGTPNDQQVIRRGLSMLLFDGLQCIERWTSTHRTSTADAADVACPLDRSGRPRRARSTSTDPAPWPRRDAHTRHGQPAQNARSADPQRTTPSGQRAKRTASSATMSATR